MLGNERSESEVKFAYAVTKAKGLKKCGSRILKMSEMMNFAGVRKET